MVRVSQDVRRLYEPSHVPDMNSDDIALWIGRIAAWIILAAVCAAPVWLFGPYPGWFQLVLTCVFGMLVGYRIGRVDSSNTDSNPISGRASNAPSARVDR